MEKVWFLFNLKTATPFIRSPSSLQLFSSNFPEKSLCFDCRDLFWEPRNCLSAGRWLLSQWNHARGILKLNSLPGNGLGFINWRSINGYAHSFLFEERRILNAKRPVTYLFYCSFSWNQIFLCLYGPIYPNHYEPIRPNQLLGPHLVQQLARQQAK